MSKFNLMKNEILRNFIAEYYPEYNGNIKDFKRDLEAEKIKVFNPCVDIDFPTWKKLCTEPYISNVQVITSVWEPVATSGATTKYLGDITTGKIYKY